MACPVSNSVPSAVAMLQAILKSGNVAAIEAVVGVLTAIYELVSRPSTQPLKH